MIHFPKKRVMRVSPEYLRRLTGEILTRGGSEPAEAIAGPGQD